ncbi:MAG: hypothetical protein AAF664_06595 [Planctomycetota bacterium]
MTLKLCREDGVYLPSERVGVRWRLARTECENIQAVELSVLWRTEGKGDEDVGVCGFWRYCNENGLPWDVDQFIDVETKLPSTPLSYHGHLLTITWLARLRLFQVGGNQVKTEVPFLLSGSRADPGF